MNKPLDLRTLHTDIGLQCALPTSFSAVEEYVLHWARNPDPGSNFARLTWLLRSLPDSLYLALLRMKRYGGHLIVHEDGIIGHAFYQEHRGCEAHMFSIKVDDAYRSQGHANWLMRSFLLEMGRRRHIEWLRISAGGDEAVVHMWKKTLKGEYDLPYCVEACDRPGLGWVHIKR